jgi:PIN domain nuclease of toxin-antitoxin system
MGLVMEVLLDTYAFIWLCSEHEKYSKKAGEIIEQAGDLFLNDASIFEIAVKQASGKLSLPDAPRRWIMAR